MGTNLDCKVCKIYHEKLDTKLEQSSVKRSPTFRDIVEHKQKLKTEKEKKEINVS